MATPQEKKIARIQKEIARMEAELAAVTSDYEVINSELEKLLTVETRQAAEESLYSFYSQSWSVFETVPFIGNWHLECICEHLEAVQRGEILNAIFMVPPRHSKLIASTVPVLTPTGWTTHGELKEGDELYHPSGKIIKVIKKHPDNVANIQITFSNGEKIKCNEDHLWQVFDRNRHKVVTETTKSLYEIWQRSNKNRCQLLLPNIKSLENKESDLPLHPYFLGLWLGDGTKNKPCITHSVEDFESIKKLESLDFKVTSVQTHKDTGVLTTYFGYQGINQKLKELSLWKNKHVPSSYIQSSIEQRCELIAGLIDSDGHVDQNGRVRIVNTNKRIIEGAYEILLSLGQRPYIEERDPVDSSTRWGIKGKLQVYSLGFQPTIEFPTAIPRKEITRLVVQRKIGITEIKYLKEAETEIGNCITVNAEDGMYLCSKSLLPTHNSSIINIAFPIWSWLQNPETKFITAAHGESLAVRDSVKSRQLIESPWFQRNWGDKVKLKVGSNQKTKYENTDNGYRIATSIGGRAVGEGFDCQTPYTKILTNKGPIPIKTLYEEKDEIVEIICFDTNSQKPQSIKPSKVLKSTLRDRKIVRITFEDGSCTDCTHDHKWWVNEEKQYVEAQYLKGKILTSTKDSIAVKEVKVLNSNIFSSSYEVYTLSMPPYGNYFVVPEGEDNAVSDNPVLAKNCLIVDDPHKPVEINSRAALNKVTEWWTGTMPSRANSPTSRRVVMHQRLSDMDLIGTILETDEAMWEVIRLPMEYEPTTFVSSIGWSDPRTQEGEILWPERFPPFEVTRLKKELGSYGFAAHYQQRPAAKEGGIIKRDWINYYPTPFNSYLIKDFNLIIQSWDLSFSNTGDYTVGQVWGKKGPHKYLLDEVRGKWTFTEQLHEIRNLKAKWPQTRIILVENAANGAAAIDSLRREIPGLIAINPKEIGGGDKETRVAACSLDFEAGNIYIPSLQIAEWVKDYVQELTTFPKAKYDDSADATAMALNWFASKAGNNIGLMASKDDLKDLNRIIPSKYTKQFSSSYKKEADFSSASRSIINQSSVKDLRNIF
jgi:predicted phage terminase large subunit-like protein